MEQKTFNAETLKKYSVNQLKSLLKNATGEKRKAIIQVLEKRNCLDIPYTDAEIKAMAKKEGIKLTPEAQKPKENKKPKAKEENAPDVKKPLKKEVSSEKVLEDLERASGNKGKRCEFFCNKTQSNEKGQIIGVRLDKRSNFIQYRIRLESDASLIFGKGIDSEDLTILE